MPQYSAASFEELRMADYAHGFMAPAATGVGAEPTPVLDAGEGMGVLDNIKDMTLSLSGVRTADGSEGGGT